MPKILKTSEDWAKTELKDIQILDPDGWNRRDLQFSWYEELITREEFHRRLMQSTIMGKFKRHKTIKKDNTPPVDKKDMELYIDEDNLNAEMIDQPLRYKKYLTEKARVSHKVKSIKAKLEFTKAEKRLEAAKTGARVKELDSMVTTDPEVMQLQKELYSAEEEYDIIDGVCRAFYQRAELLKEISTNRRRELLD